MKRQVQVVKPNATDAEIEDVMKSEGGKDALYKERILAEGSTIKSSKYDSMSLILRMYILIRFRKMSYSIGAVAAVFHDATPD